MNSVCLMIFLSFFSGSDVLGSYAAEKRDVTSKTWLLQGRALDLFTLAHAWTSLNIHN